MAVAFNHTSILARQTEKPLLGAFRRVIRRGTFLEGPENARLQRNLRTFLDCPAVLSVASGHDALVLALRALHVQPDDEVILPDVAYPTAFAVAQVPCRLVLADCDANGQLGLAEIQNRTTAKTKAIVAVHLYGITGDLVNIARWAKQHHIELIEDCAQAFGTTITTPRGQKHVGTFGRFGCYSFYPTKNLGTLGDGGALACRQRADLTFLQRAKAYGEKTRYGSDFVSGHSRLPEIQAAALRIYLGNFRRQQQLRRQVEAWYQKELAALAPFLRVITSHADSSPTRHLLVIRAQQRDGLQTFLKRHGIETHIHYPAPVHAVPAFAHLRLRDEDFPQSTRFAQEILSLPFHGYLRKRDVMKITRLIKQFYVQQLPNLHSLTLVFPAYNDAHTIGQLVAKAHTIGSLVAKKHAVVVVNDGSQDHTSAVLAACQKKYPHLRVIQHPQNLGYGAALQTGFAACRTEWLFYTDGDGQYDPFDLVRLLQTLKKHPGVAAVSGYKMSRQDSWIRQCTGQVYNGLQHLLYRLPIRDLDCDFRLMKTDPVQTCQLQSHSGLICLELITQLNRQKVRFAEVGVPHYAREFGHSQFFRPAHLWATAREEFLYFRRFYGAFYATKYPRVKNMV